jgi:hypothetical protein
MNSPIIGPVVALAGWTMFIQGWMYAKRIPAILRNNIKMDPNVPGSELLRNLPPEVRWKADNYNNLMEQPTVFYAVCFALALQGAGHGINAKMAWSYVAARVAHSLVQVTFNNITARFSLFMLGSAPLLGLVIQAAKNQFL